MPPLSEFYADHVEGKPLTRELWFRDIFLEPRLEDGHTWTFWQYANRGRLDGVTGPVDMNVFRGDAAAWSAY